MEDHIAKGVVKSLRILGRLSLPVRLKKCVVSIRNLVMTIIKSKLATCFIAHLQNYDND